jgi:hypothetical protein
MHIKDYLAYPENKNKKQTNIERRLPRIAKRNISRTSTEYKKY